MDWRGEGFSCGTSSCLAVWTKTRQILRFLAQEVSPHTFVNVMPQYRPEGFASQYPAIARLLRESEFQDALAIAREEGLGRLARG
jgi:putative pyruvate formate lyase activating enzyme